MKKVITTFIALALFTIDSYSLCDIYRLNGGPLGLWFKTVQYSGGGSTYTPNGVEITDPGCAIICTDPGFLRCRASNSGIVGHEIGDQVDLSAIDRLLDLSDDMIEDGQIEGNCEIRIRVEGEKFERIYVIDWKLNSNGDGKMHVERTDIVF